MQLQNEQLRRKEDIASIQLYPKKLKVFLDTNTASTGTVKAASKQSKLDYCRNLESPSDVRFVNIQAKEHRSPSYFKKKTEEISPAPEKGYESELCFDVMSPGCVKPSNRQCIPHSWKHSHGFHTESRKARP